MLAVRWTSKCSTEYNRERTLSALAQGDDYLISQLSCDLICKEWGGYIPGYWADDKNLSG